MDQHVRFAAHTPRSKELEATTPVVDMDITSQGRLKISYAPNLQEDPAYDIASTLSLADLSNSDDLREMNLFDTASYLFNRRVLVSISI